MLFKPNHEKMRLDVNTKTATIYQILTIYYKTSFIRTTHYCNIPIKKFFFRRMQRRVGGFEYFCSLKTVKVSKLNEIKTN